MGRHASDNLAKAIAMARNGQEAGFRAAWLICNELEGGATTWGNAQRAFKAACKAAEQQPTPTPTAKTKGKANAARTAETATRTGTIVPPRVQRTSLQVAKALELQESYAEEHKRVHKMATVCRSIVQSLSERLPCHVESMSVSTISHPSRRSLVARRVRAAVTHIAAPMHGADRP